MFYYINNINLNMSLLHVFFHL